MISHGFVSGAMFLCIGVMYDRMHSRNIADYGGVVNTMPKFAAFFMLFAMANCGLPATSGFVGEFMVILAAVQVQLLDRADRGRHDADSRRGLLAVDVQARDLRRGREQPTSPHLNDINAREFAILGAARRRGAVDGVVSEAVHRPDGCVGGAAACSTSREVKLPVQRRRNESWNSMNLSAALPEIVLLAGALRRPGRRSLRQPIARRNVTYALDAACVAGALVAVRLWRAAGRRHGGLRLRRHVRRRPDGPSC